MKHVFAEDYSPAPITDDSTLVRSVAEVIARESRCRVLMKGGLDGHPFTNACAKAHPNDVGGIGDCWEKAFPLARAIAAAGFLKDKGSR